MSLPWRCFTSSSDDYSFRDAGIPAFQFIHDPMGYWARTHHTNVDTFERLDLDALRDAAIVVAATAYHLAMRDEMMPRVRAGDAR